MKYFTLISLLLYASTSWAYLDPGSVSIWLQAILALIAGFLATFKFWWKKLRIFSKRNNATKPE